MEAADRDQESDRAGGPALIDDFAGERATADPAVPFEKYLAVLFEFVRLVDAQIREPTPTTPGIFDHPVALAAISPIEIPAHP